ncbi:MAG: methyltransferase domain-containing protein [Henriciella sp.]|nr:methyltransferase domain-containing protein [Henriciella sp.]
MPNDAQIDIWNGPSGQKWADQSSALDGLLAPFASSVLESGDIKAGEKVLDIGCGAGAMTLQAANIADGKVSALGVDVSEPLINLARQRASQTGSSARFELADASTFSTQEKFDIAISRFGVMFFDHPASAFQNIRNQVTPEGRIVFVCWQAITLNEWIMGPIQAAIPFLKQTPTPSDPNAPGPFAFADKDRVYGHLSEAGWQGISIEPLITELTLPGTSLETTANLMLQIGPLAGLISEQEIDPKPVHQAVVERLSKNLSSDGRVRMDSACWIVQAQAS